MRPGWNQLDNAAKIYPSAGTKAETHVFRFSCELYEEIDPILLQEALDGTIVSFPVFQYLLKRGVFWYYLESTNLKPVVRQEYKPPCDEIYDNNQKSLLYEVTYYRKTINLEVFHVLTDGTGAMQFLRILVNKYLALAHQIPEPTLDYDASHAQMSDDSFQKYYERGNGKKQKEPHQKKACQLTGSKFAENRTKIIRGIVSVKGILKAAHEHHATLTEFLAAAMIQAIQEELPLRAKRRPVVLTIPVNLRNYFESASARNFFSIVFTDYDFSAGGSVTFDDILRKVHDDFEKELTKENLTMKLNANAALERNFFARIAPLFFKDIVLKTAYELSAKGSTAALSNVGIVRMPPETGEFVRSMDVCVSTNRLQACVCSYGDRLSISFTSPFISSDIQRRFFRRLTDLGLDVEIATNQIADE